MIKAAYSSVLATLMILISVSLAAGATKWVDASAGFDQEDSGAYTRPYKTITYAMKKAVAGDTIICKVGYYNAGSGEEFPIIMTSGVQLQSQIDLCKDPERAVIEGNVRFVDISNQPLETSLRGFKIEHFNQPVSFESCYNSAHNSIVLDGNIIVTNYQPAGTTGIYLRRAGNVLISNNVIYSKYMHNGQPGGWGLDITHASSASVINNTFDNWNAAMNLYTSSGSGPLYAEIANNNFTGSTYGISYYWPWGNCHLYNITWGANLFYDNGSDYGSGSGEICSTGGALDVQDDPDYVIYPAVEGSFDFHLGTGSAAINAGGDVSGSPWYVTTDLDGNSRPYPGGGFDTGAYESPY